MNSGRLILVAVYLLASACGPADADEEDIVDTSLNDLQTASEPNENVSNPLDEVAVEERPRRQGASETERSSARRREAPYYDDEEYVAEPEANLGPRRATAAAITSLFTGDDYPADAQRNDEQGTVTVEMLVGTDGRVTGCTVIGSSGSRSLDNATCRIIRSRARFAPALDAEGRPTLDTVTRSITWRLEG